MDLVSNKKRRRGRFVLLLGGLLAVAATAAALYWIDFEKYRSDPERVKRLSAAEIPLVLPNAHSLDWPQWRGPNRDGVSTEVGLHFDWPADGPTTLWKKPIGRGFSSFAIANGRLFTMDQEVLGDPVHSINECIVCLDAGTGNELWRFRYPNQYDERFGPGPRSTPAIDGDFIYAIGPTGIFHCLDAKTGAKTWRHDLLEEFQGRPMQYGVSCSPLIEGNYVYVAPGGENGNSVASFDKLTGTLAWKALDDPASYSSPIAISVGGVRQILFLTNTQLASFAPDGSQLLWRYPWKAEGGFNIATPISFGNYVLVSSGYGKGSALLEVTGTADGKLQVGAVYEHNRFRPFFSSAVRLDDHVYGFDQNDLVCMNLRTGNIAWRQKDMRSFKKASIVGVEGRLLVLGESGILTLIEASPTEYREKASCRISQTRCWAPPALANGRLYVRDDAEIMCFELRKK